MLVNIFAVISPMALVWLVALILFAVVEATTRRTGFYLVCWRFISSIDSTAGLRAPIWLQIVLFLAVSIVMLALLRPFVKKVSKPQRTRTNADRHIGQTALVTEEIDNLKETGAVRLDGVIWTARSESGETIPVGTIITVRRIEGVKVWVEPVAEPIGV